MSLRAGAFLLAAATLVGAAEFTADVELKEPSGNVCWKLYVKGGVYRLEGEEKGQRKIVIVDRAADTATVIDPQAKTYEFIKGFKIAWVDPFYRMMLIKGNLHKAEGETVELDGRSCKRFTYTDPTQRGPCVEVWHAIDLDHIVKQVVTQVTSSGKRTVEMTLSNITVGPVDVALVKIPEGLERKKSPEEIEAALPSLSEVADAEAPVGRRLSAGGELRVKVDADRIVQVYVENRIKGESVATVVACHKGQPRENIGVTPWKLTGIGGYRDRKFNDNVKMFGDTFRVDEVRIKVDKGLCEVKVEQSDRDRMDLYVLGGRRQAWGRGKKTGLTITITGDHQAGPKSIGTLILRMPPKQKTEEFTLENGQSKTWTFSAEQGVKSFSVKVELGKGGVKVCAK